MTERRPNRIYFDAGVAHTVVLKFPNGLPTSYGNILYTTTEGKQFFVPKDVSHKIQALGLAELEPLRIGKSDRDEWIVGRMKQEPGSTLASAPAPVAQQATSPALEASPSLSNLTSMSQQIASCYIAALDGLRVVEEYAKKHGVAFRITEDVLHTTANSAFIELGKRQERELRQREFEARYGRAPQQQNGGAAWRQ